VGSGASLVDHEDEQEPPPMGEDEETELSLGNEGVNPCMHFQPFTWL
jgi:hypothetical protein